MLRIAPVRSRPSARPSRRAAALALGLLAAAGALLALPSTASAGYGVQPNGQTIEVEVDSRGSISAPKSIHFLVYMDSLDYNGKVWVSASPEIGSYGLPAGGIVGSCSAFSAWEEPDKYTCPVGTVLMRPGRTYYWWLTHRRRDTDNLAAQLRVSGPFPFTLERAVPPPPPPAPPPPPGGTAPTATYHSAATLPTATRYTGVRSIKHQTLTQVVYKTMKLVGLPRVLAFACWRDGDYESVYASAGGGDPDLGTVYALAFWHSRQPRWLHLSPTVCDGVQRLFDTRAPTGRNAAALAVALHETMHAYGVANEALANCLAVQLVPYAALNAGFTRKRSTYLGSLAVRYIRLTAPRGYWNAQRCRDGGAWDLFPAATNLS